MDFTQNLLKVRLLIENEKFLPDRYLIFYSCLKDRVKGNRTNYCSYLKFIASFCVNYNFLLEKNLKFAIL